MVDEVQGGGTGDLGEDRARLGATLHGASLGAIVRELERDPGAGGEVAAAARPGHPDCAPLSSAGVPPG
jgi:hypothetical protein